MDMRLDRVEAKLDRSFFWLLSFEIAAVAAMFGAMARGFGWL
jgi:hypothetical protein